MAKISAIDITSLNFQEGAAPSTPASTKWRLYFKTTGLFVIDDAGVEIGPLVSSVLSGTSFPGSPAANDIFYRTDRDLLYFYDGTRWLTAHLANLPIPTADALLPISGTTTINRVMAPHAAVYDLWVEDFQAAFFVAGGTALGASHKWVVTLLKQPAATVIATINIDSGASSAWRNSGQIAIDALLGVTNFELECLATKTGTPGTLYLMPMLTYRMVG